MLCVGVNKNTHGTTSMFMQHLRTFSCGPVHALVKAPVFCMLWMCVPERKSDCAVLALSDCVG